MTVRKNVAGTKKAGKLAILLLVFCMLLPLSAAAAPDQQEAACLNGDPYDLDQLIEVMSRPNPPTFPVQLNDDLSLVYTGVGDMTAGGEDEAEPGPEPRPNPRPTEPSPDATNYGPLKIRAFNNANKFMFDITMSERMLKRIARCREQAGLTSADGGEAGLGAPEGRQAFLPLMLNGATDGVPTTPQRGWSNGNDTRIVRTPTTLWPWRAIAQQSFVGDDESRCTQTLIGPRHMVTAAHCIVNFGTTAWKTRELTPGRDGPGVSPYGMTTITPNPAPGDTVWYFVPSQWTDPSTSNQWVWDWGMVVIPDYLGYQTGWMGYGAWSAGVLNGLTHLNRGYPRCNVPNYNGEPANCQQARLYGDSNVCELGDYSDQLADGWNRRISVSCDLSKGHSGSAIYHYRYDPHLGKTVPVVTMVVSTESCTNTCSATNDFPNGARRLTPADVAVISFFREAFP